MRAGGRQPFWGSGPLRLCLGIPLRLDAEAPVDRAGGDFAADALDLDRRIGRGDFFQRDAGGNPQMVADLPSRAVAPEQAGFFSSLVFTATWVASVSNSTRMRCRSSAVLPRISASIGTSGLSHATISTAAIEQGRVATASVAYGFTAIHCTASMTTKPSVPVLESST